MINNTQEALSFIESRHMNASSLESFKELLKKHHNIEKTLKCVHITGTNGKGSTSKLMNDFLCYSNYKVGLFTSPHMIVANDRIRINNEYISDEDLVFYVNKFYDDIIEYSLNFFQIYTLVALNYFYDQGCDFCIIEVGIGGLFDSTNVVNSLISIITNISFDHTAKLGNRLTEIAEQKAGIIKPNSTVITMVKDPESLNVIQTIAHSQNSKLYVVDHVTSSLHDGGRVFEYNNKEYFMNSLAKYQVDNALVALQVASILKDEYEVNIDDNSIRMALKTFKWLGRFEVVSSDPEIIIDGAHNIEGIKSMIDSDTSDSVVIFSALKDKEYDDMLKLLMDNYIEVVFVEFDFYRSIKLDDLEHLHIQKYTTLNDALDYVKNKYPNKRIIICGSLYFISDVRSSIVKQEG